MGEWSSESLFRYERDKARAWARRWKALARERRESFAVMLRDQDEAMRAEVERLREALAVIAAGSQDACVWLGSDFQDIARRTLADTREPKP